MLFDIPVRTDVVGLGPTIRTLRVRGEDTALHAYLGIDGGATPIDDRPPAAAAKKTPPAPVSAGDKPKVDLGEIDRYLAGLAKPS